MIRQLLKAGMNVARLNFSHGTNDEHLKRLNNLRDAASELNKDLGILLDIQGPKIRLGRIKENKSKVMLEAGNEYTLTVTPCEGDHLRAFVGYEKMPRDVRKGSTVYIDDGLLELRVKEVQGPDIICEVIVGGELSSRKGVTLPGIDVDLPPITDEDIEHIRFGVEHGVDFIAASFVRKAEHVMAVNDIVTEAGGTVPVIAKIESDEGLRNIDEIIRVADGVMVARGDLGVEIPHEEVPLVQKMLIKKCNRAGIPVITATQMLDSMIRNPRPTRAEITDIANAIIDGTDCVMLSGETAVGKYPVRAVEVMHQIAVRIENSIDYRSVLEEKTTEHRQNIPQAISLATCQTAYDLGVKSILCSTQSGATARCISMYRPKATIVALTPSESVVRQLTISWGGISSACTPC